MATNRLKFVGCEVLDTLEQAAALLESAVTPRFQEEICEIPAERLSGMHLALGIWMRNYILKTELESRILLLEDNLYENAANHIVLAFWQRLRARRWSRTSRDVAPKLPRIVVLGLGEYGARFVTNFQHENQDASIAADTLFLTRTHFVQALGWPFNPPPEDRHALEEAFLDAQEVLIVGASGGSLCRIFVGSFLSLARKNGIAPSALVSLPAEWEGGIRCGRALEAVSGLELSGFDVITVHESCLSNLDTKNQEQWYGEIGKQVEQKIGDWLKLARQRVSSI